MIAAETAETRPPLLEVRGLDRLFGGFKAVDQASFSIEEGAIAGLIGPNGAGKTTCFNCVAGFLKPSAGQVFFAGHEITGRPSHRVFHDGLVRTFQIPQEIPTMSVLENLMLPGEGQAGEQVWRNWLPLTRRVGREEREREERARDVLRTVGLDTHVHHSAGELSGGQRKLLELARALMSEPRMILLDEPAAGINPTLLRSLVDHVREIREQGVTFLIIEHNLDLVRELCDPVVLMAEGRVIHIDHPEEVLGDPEVQAIYMRRRTQ